MEKEGGYLIGKIKYLTNRRLNRLFIENGLNEFTGEQGKIFYFLWKDDGVPSTEIARKTGLAVNTLTNMLDKMEKSGLIYRKESEKDKRKKLVFLTKEGKRLESKSNYANERMNEIFYRGFSGEEIELFEKQLKRIIDNLDDGDE